LSKAFDAWNDGFEVKALTVTGLESVRSFKHCEKDFKLVEKKKKHNATTAIFLKRELI
jgi:hypothetical protein